LLQTLPMKGEFASLIQYTKKYCETSSIFFLSLFRLVLTDLSFFLLLLMSLRFWVAMYHIRMVLYHIDDVISRTITYAAVCNRTRWIGLFYLGGGAVDSLRTLQKNWVLAWNILKRATLWWLNPVISLVAIFLFKVLFQIPKTTNIKPNMSTSKSIQSLL